MIDKHLIAKTSPKANQDNVLVWNDIRVTVLTPRLFRVEKDTDRVFCDEATQSVWFRDMAKVEYSVSTTAKTLTVTTSDAVLKVYEDVFRSTVTVDGKTVCIGKVKNLPGAYRSLDCCDGSFYNSDRRDEKYPITLEDGIVSKCGVGVYDDARSLILGQDGTLRARDDDEADVYIFAHGKDYRGAIKDLFTVSGRVPMIPRYALGNWWSRYHAYTDKEYLHILDKLEGRDVPLTVATIDMDWHWSTTLDERKKITEQGKNDEYHGGAKGWTGYSWNTDLFPDYRSFLNKIKERDLKITLNLHPAMGVRYFEDMYEEMAKAVGVDPQSEAHIPFDFTSDDFINAYFKILHKPYEADGVQFWWIDWQQGTKTSMPGLDPLWALNHYHTLDNAVDHAPLILSRYCGIGSHRYPLGFSGDTYVTWKSLAFIPYFTAMGTNAGYTWWSHDIGGHMHGFKDDELYMRYVQFGVFSPINRLHCCDFEVCTKEPEVYMNGAGHIAEDFLRLRHKMIPFLYSASYDTYHNGQALIEPMYYAYPECAEAYKCDRQYMFGDQLIVAPVTAPSDKDGLSVTKVWLPEGKWTDIFTGDEYNGGRWIEAVRWMNSIPVFAKEGGFFLLDSRRHTNSVSNPDALTVMVFNGNGEYTLHESNGEDGDSRESFMHTHFVSTAGDGVQTLELYADGDTSVVSERKYRFEFRNIPTGDVKVYADGKEIAFETDEEDYISVIIENVRADVKYRVEVCYTADRRKYRNDRIMYNLRRLQAEYRTLRYLYRDVNELDDDECRNAIEAHTKLTKNQKKRLLEAW